MAYSARMAAALSGTTLRQLSYWKSSHGSGPLLSPELSVGSRRLYSFRDVIALRTVGFLRSDASLQRVRRAVSNLRLLGSGDHLSTYKLVASDDSIVWIDGQEFIDLVKRPRQHVIAEMSEVLAGFVNAAGTDVPALLEPRPLVTVDPGVMSGHPVVAGTRVPFELVAGLLRDGMPAQTVADYYPGVSAEAARQALDYAEYVDRVVDGAVA
ncbi:MAG: DUF433 domain-containing protein [Actinobacteria bacterium]|nr:DUF433 domain-containing protein [Actinomycetota bacterium]